MPAIETTPELVSRVYETMLSRLETVRKRLGRPLTYAEKVLFGHLNDPQNQELSPGEAYLLLRPDRVAMQDATAQMALLQFMQAGVPQTAVPSTVHCDHLIRAHAGAKEDTATAIQENREVYEFLRTVSAKYNIGFWQAGAGIIHQVVIENYAFPGGMMIGTDSHTPNAGGLGMIACGVGGADAVDVMAGFPWEVLHPHVVGVRLVGELNGWTSPKDVILKLCGILTVKGGTNRIIEYFGPGVKAISATGKATITNMGAELGATTSIFPYDETMAAYLRGTNREALADLADRHRDLLKADPEVEQAPETYYHQVIEIDLSTLEPHVVGPHSPDLARPVSQLGKDAKAGNFPERFSIGLIGSCTNSSYEDITRAADVAKQAFAHGLKAQAKVLVTPGSEMVLQTITRDGQLADLENIGATVLSNACGPCIGQWKRDDIQMGQPDAIITSYNRNFPKRNDGNPGTLAFVASPEVVIAYALAGRLDFNPLTDTLTGADGQPFKLQAPAKAPALPAKGFTATGAGYLAPAADGSAVEVAVAPDSDRLQLLAPFSAWDGKDFQNLPLLLKAKGKCTTDHISPAGPWLKYRGHLDKISDNAYLGAVNAFTGEVGKGLNQLTAETDQTFSQIARAYKAKGLRWVVVGDENLGEGSSREHAAMSPRYLGAAAVLVRSFARIHETNLKKQGVLPLTFAQGSDYDLVQETDRISIVGLDRLAPEQPLTVLLHHADGREDKVTVRHSLNPEQIEWFKAGAALNILKQTAAAGRA